MYLGALGPAVLRVACVAILAMAMGIIAVMSFRIGASICCIAILLAMIHSLRISIPGLVVITVPISFYVALGPSTVNASPADILLPLLAVVAISSQRPPDQTPATPSGDGMSRFLASYILLVLILIAASVNIVSADAKSSLVAYSILGIFKTVVSMSYIGLIFLWLSKTGSLTHLLVIWSVSSHVLIGVCLIASAAQVAGLPNPVTDLLFDAYRLAGPADDPNAFASYLMLSLGVYLCAAVARGRPVRLWFPTAIFVAILFTGSRAAAPALLVALAIIWMTSPVIRRTWRPMAAGLIVTAGLAGFVLLTVQIQVASLSRVVQDSGPRTGDTDVRFTLWAIAWRLWTDNPWVGVGYGQFRDASEDIAGYGFSSIPHNTYLTLLAETGTFTALAFLSLPFFIGYALFKQHRRGDPISSGLLVGLTAVAIQATTLNVENFRPLWVYLAMSAYWLTRDPLVMSGTPAESARHTPGNRQG